MTDVTVVKPEQPPAMAFSRAFMTLAIGAAAGWLVTLPVSNNERTLAIAAVVSPVLITLASLVALARLGRGNLGNLISPTGASLTMVGTYFGFGALLPMIAPEDLWNYMQEEYPYSLAELVTAHRVNALGILFLTVTAAVLLRAFPPPDFKVGRVVDTAYLRRVASRMLIVGTAIRLLVTTPWALGAHTGLLPGIVGALDVWAMIGMLMMAYGVSDGLLQRKSDLITLSICTFINVAIGFISLSKLNFFMSAGAPMAGVILARPRLRILLLFAVLIPLSYSFMSPLVTLGRARAGNSAATIADRVAVVSTTAKLLEESSELEAIKGLPLMRFSYVNASVCATRSYNNGLPGHSMSQFWWVFVPRMLWPDKPNMTSTGRDVAIAMTGNDNTLTGIGVFCEAYWNAGYLGVILATIFVGGLLAFLESLRWRALESFDGPNMFVFWQGCFMAYETSFLVPTYIGSWPIIIAGYVIVAITMGRAPGRTARVSSRAPAPVAAG